MPNVGPRPQSQDKKIMIKTIIKRVRELERIMVKNDCTLLITQYKVYIQQCTNAHLTT